MIWEDKPLDTVQEKLRQMGIHVVDFNPAGNASAMGDYFTVMEQNLLGLRFLTKQ